ncbi:hypothetical protein BDQ17DRAFT_744956 [Cyathus striatus]|nr:hypothetical protein BDQ17DRAFT_744956 [Cyathus striatus]
MSSSLARPLRRTFTMFEPKAVYNSNSVAKTVRFNQQYTRDWQWAREGAVVDWNARKEIGEISPQASCRHAHPYVPLLAPHGTSHTSASNIPFPHTTTTTITFQRLSAALPAVPSIIHPPTPSPIPSSSQLVTTIPNSHSSRIVVYRGVTFLPSNNRDAT